MTSVTLCVEQRRGFAVEATHLVDAVACTSAGEVSVLSGVDALTTFRSAGKPFQLEATLALLAEATRAELTPVDLALGTASHHGESFHLAELGRLLSKLGVSERDLYCGAHPPLHKESADALIRGGEPSTALHNNCSGKHAFMAAAARAQGLDADYRAIDHPLQQQVLAGLDARTGRAVAGTVVDGCGVPCFVLALSAMARAYATLAVAGASDDGSALSAIAGAMRAHPLLVSGTDAFDGWLMQHAPVLAKVGALGLLCVAVPEHGLGLAIKVRSGSELVRAVAVQAILERVVSGLLVEALPARFHCVYNVVGAEVGALVTRFQQG